MNRRTILKTGALTAGMLMLSGAQVACGKNLSLYVNIIVGALKELSPLLPGQAQLIAKAIAIAETFDRAYREGKFTDAIAIFENLAGVLGEIADAAGVTNPQVRTALAVAGIALRAIAVLLKSREGEPVVVEAIGTATVAQRRQIALVNRLAEPAPLDAAIVK